MAVIVKRDKENMKITRKGPIYRQIKKIGNGTFGHISSVIIEGEKLAIKRFTYSDDALHLTTLREIKALMSIKSKYIVEIKEIVIDDYKINMVMPFYEFDLYRMLGIENLTMVDVKHIFWQVLMGIKDTHMAGYLHRDLKSANILINKMAVSNKRHCSIGSMDEDYNAREYSNRDDYNYNNRDYGRDDYNYNNREYSRDDYNYNNREYRRDVYNRNEYDSREREYVNREYDEREYDNRNAYDERERRYIKTDATPELIENRSLFDAKICDFGMARTRSSEMTPCVITLWYRPPEVLLGSVNYTKSADIWSLGCILLEMLKKIPIFKSDTEVEMLNLISELCGSINDESLPGASNLPLFTKYRISEGKRRILEKFSSFGANVADLADKMLVLDPSKRLTVTECLEHPFFTS